MIEKIIQIKDIGRFANYNAKGTVSNLSELTLIYGPNGSGKSTLSSIFKSLENNETRHVRKRERVSDSPTSPAVLLKESGVSEPLKFKDKLGWNTILSNVHVFDSSFTHDNIYSGESVFKNQRESLFLLLFLDEKGKGLLNKAEVISNEITQVNRSQKPSLDKIMLILGFGKNDTVTCIRGTHKKAEMLERYESLLKDDTFKHLVSEFKDIDTRRNKLIIELKPVKESILEQAQSTLEVYESKVNQYLRRLSAGFSVSKIGVSNFNGLSQRIKYGISVNGMVNEIFSSNTVNHGKPYFDTLLSEADKRTLSLCFFLSKLDSIEDKENAIVVFDDPMSSFDMSRRLATKQEILSLSSKVKQLIVLSHDPQFLFSFWKDSTVKNPALIKINKLRKCKSELIEWDVERDCESEYITKYKSLYEYLDGDMINENQIAMSIRIVLEEYFRLKFPWEFANKEWLGGFLEKVRNCGEGHTLFRMKRHLDELSAICDYSSPHHHSNPPPVDSDELESYIKRALLVLQD